MYCRPPESMAPHSGLGGWMPSPIKESPAAFRIAEATPSVDWTMIGAMLLGMMCFRMMRRSELPTDRAASTNSMPRMESTDPRTMRA